MIGTDTSEQNKPTVQFSVNPNIIMTFSSWLKITQRDFELFLNYTIVSLCHNSWLKLRHCIHVCSMTPDFSSLVSNSLLSNKVINLSLWMITCLQVSIESWSKPSLFIIYWTNDTFLWNKWLVKEETCIIRWRNTCMI